MIVATFFTHVFLKRRPEFSFNLQFKNSFDLLMKSDMYLKVGCVINIKLAFNLRTIFLYIYNLIYNTN